MLCRCGCGQEIPDNYNWRIRYIYGHQWKNHRIDIFRQYSARHCLRRPAIKVYGDACVMCGWDITTLDIHHINPIHTVESVIILCPNCHRMVHEDIVPKDELLEKQKELLKGYKER